jgi:hypothetical protein
MGEYGIIDIFQGNGQAGGVKKSNENSGSK